MSLIKCSVCPFEKQKLACKICEGTNGAMESMFCNEDDERLLSKIFKCTNVTVKPVCGIISPICEFCRSRIDQFDDTFQPRCKEYVVERVTSCTGPEDDPFNCIDPMSVSKNDNDAKEIYVDNVCEIEDKNAHIREVHIPNILGKEQVEKDKSNGIDSTRKEDAECPPAVTHEDPDQRLADTKADGDDNIDDSQDDNHSEFGESDDMPATENRPGRRKVEVPFGVIKKPSKCEICGKSVAYMKDHMRMHSEQKKYKCPDCDRSFSQSNNLVYHMRKHTGEKPFACDKCDKRFICKSHLLSHARSHVNDQPFQCEFCSKRFNQACNLTKHRRLHTGEKPYKCGVCEKAFMNLSNMKAHEKRHRGERNFTCEICSKSFYDNHHLERHIATHTKTKKHKCSICLKEFSTAAGLKSHEANHKNPLQAATCEICQKYFSCERKLGLHLKSHDSNNSLQKAYKCNFCSKSFDRIDQLDLHKQKHTNSKFRKRNREIIIDPETATRQLKDGLSKPYRCTVCFKIFNQASGLRLHLKLHMFKEEAFSCTTCFRSFEGDEQLSAHVCTHADSEPLQGEIGIPSESTRESAKVIQTVPLDGIRAENGVRLTDIRTKVLPETNQVVAKLEIVNN
ncbi:zinc finger protein 678-like [Toxorhynchites rutilus septentrionalis]|uniref:zinc finger protein 678-like n=1 Tax=Toxorhynchites rutilus septentrionalis TaxID=329112 RepID=UPI00247AE4C4|nr:zinc finger protein 678-like [Toxorhynchites rutilus septentrionalis]